MNTVPGWPPTGVPITAPPPAAQAQAPAGIGHNAPPPDIPGISSDRLRSYIERIQRLMAERDALTADIKEVFAEAKGVGFDTKIMRKTIALMKKNAADMREERELVDLYLKAMGFDF